MMEKKIQEALERIEKSVNEINKEMARMRQKNASASIMNRICFNMLEEIIKDRKEKHRQNFAFMTATIKLLQRIANKAGPEEEK